MEPLVTRTGLPLRPEWHPGKGQTSLSDKPEAPKVEDNAVEAEVAAEVEAVEAEQDIPSARTEQTSARTQRRRAEEGHKNGAC